MQIWRIQPLTTIAVTAGLSGLQQWGLLGVFGAAMFIGAVFPPINLLDFWISLVSRTRHRTVLHPRRFASGMGGVMLMAASVSAMYGHFGAAWTFALLTIGAASLLVAFKFCLGCWIYNTLVAPLVSGKTRAA